MTTSTTKTASYQPDSALACTLRTPAGPFTVIAAQCDQGPAVLASGWTDDVGQLLPLIAPGLRPGNLVETDRIDGITERITAYHDGQLDAIETVRVRQRSGPFIEHTWDVLRAVPAGRPVTYTELAGRSGRPKAIRAAGSACSRNAAALFVPCHRVTRSGGDVGSFRWGPQVKSWLLEHEGTA